MIIIKTFVVVVFVVVVVVVEGGLRLPPDGQPAPCQRGLRPLLRHQEAGGLYPAQHSHQQLLLDHCALHRTDPGVRGIHRRAKETIKFSSNWADGTRGCPGPGTPCWGTAGTSCMAWAPSGKVIRTLKFSEHRDLGCFTVRCHITTLPGRYRHEEDYRSVLLHNYEDACKVDQYAVE